ncbi:MAG TPA: hypothetical protein VHE55_01390 [Fimbriimonadaceae bacterium]|nr:hypothetical protein [Fimbriimonadaceae bacterium]
MEITGGKTMVSFYPAVLEANGLKVVWNSSAEGDKTRSEPSYGFQIDFSNLKYELNNGRVSRFDGGSFSHKGGFKLVSGKNSVDADQFIINPSTNLADGLELVVDTKKEAYTAFNLLHSSATYMFKERQVVDGNLDLVITLRCAQELGRPDLAGMTIGYLKVIGNSDPIDGGDYPTEPKADTSGPAPQGNLDLALSDMGGISWIAHTGSYPNGLNALTAYTTSCNVGSVNVPWNPPMATTHPGIILSLYMVNNGRFEQIGTSWVKHGFYATNTNQCGVCNTSGGYYLGPACSDTYGGGNNDDQYYLSGRDEWNAFTGVWTCQGSWFSNYVNDCTRRNTGSGLSSTDHRLTARDADLGVSGAQYYYEARYMNPNDINTYNNLASRTCTMHWTGSQWSFNTTDSAEVQGPAINRWGEKRALAQPNTEGDVIVAVQTTNLGGGNWHYEYAVYNHTSDRQVRQFTVPMPSGRTVSNIGFRDIDQTSTNDWAGSYTGDTVTWSTDTYGSSSANPLKYGTVYNFWFDANIPPVDSSAQLGLFKPGSGPDTTAATKAPVLLGPVDSFQVVNGILNNGNLASLQHWDGDRVEITGSAASSSGVIVTATSPTSTPTELIIGVVSRIGVGSSLRQVQSIQLWNYNTSAWEQVDSRLAQASDTMTNVAITSDPGRFVGPGQQMQAKVTFSGPPTAANAFRAMPQFDQIGFQVN